MSFDSQAQTSLCHACREIFVCTTVVMLSMLTIVTATAQTPSQVRSHITIINYDGTGKRVLHTAAQLFEAPNWSPDGKHLILNSQGKLWRLPVAGGTPQLIPTGTLEALNNDHGISPDGREVAISDNTGPIFIVPFVGGTPRRVTEQKPSYYHGWSPDGRRLAYVSQPTGENQYDLFSIAITGGVATRLTAHANHDDGPDYSPDGRWIYFNSDRAGGAGYGDIWRIPASGAGAGDRLAERITSDGYVDWFPHPSPDGKWLVFLSYEQGTLGHPANKNVVLRRMRLPDAKPGARVETGKITEVVKLFGGQGTINVASWSPDSRRFAYVSYTPIDESGSRKSGSPTSCHQTSLLPATIR